MKDKIAGTALPKIKTKIPGPKSNRLTQDLLRYECPNITGISSDSPIFWERARGSNVVDVDGNTYIDLTSGFGVTNAGHGNSKVIDALIKQAKNLPHSLGDVYPARIKVKLLEALSQIVPKPLEQTFLASSGSEAVEIAMKTAMLATEKPGIIVFEGSYHGLTYGALQATSLLDFQIPFLQQLGTHVTRVPFPISYPHKISEEEVLVKIHSIIRRQPIGAILIEPIQGRGGVRIASVSFMKHLRKLCSEHKILLIADEIYSGFARTGKFFAFEYSGIVPDLVTVGKGLSGGFPISACIGTPSVMSVWPRHRGEALHTSTFLGNPLGCAMALASIQEIKTKRLVQRAHSLGDKFLKKLRFLKSEENSIGDVRGRGLMIGLEIVKNSKNYRPDPEKAGRTASECLKRGLIVLSDGIHQNVLAITPPLVITEKQMDCAVKIIRLCLQQEV